jgi:cell division cycle 2-like
MRQLLAAVERSHRAGVLHWDVKPENVVVDDGTAPDVDDDDDRKKNRRHHRQPPPPPPEEITCKLCDFGTSEPMTEGRREYSPLATSEPYRAPELFLGLADYDGRIDSWGLGCVMAELLVGTGGAFFEGKTRRTSSPTR